MGDAIPLQHGADQFSLSVKNGERVPTKTAFVKFEPAGSAVTHGVRHSSFIQVSTPQYLQPHKSARRNPRGQLAVAILSNVFGGGATMATANLPRLSAGGSTSSGRGG